MRQTILLIFFISIGGILFGQTIKTETEIKGYLKQNISSLDPLEGIWSIENMTYTIFHKNQSLGENPIPSQVGRRFAIIKEGKKFIEYIYLKGRYEVNDGNYYESKGMIGEYFYHSEFLKIMHTVNVSMKGLFSLEYLVKVEHRAIENDEGLNDLAKSKNESNTNNIGLEMAYKEAKIYPTYSDYKDATDNIKAVHQISSGTGFALSSKGFIATNYHVVEGASKLSVRGINGDFTKSFNAKVIVVDKNNDLAIIQIDDATFISLSAIPYSIKTTLSEVGENINVLGYPLTATMGEEIKFTNGIISSKSGFQGDITCYQCSAPVQPGNSGGPMFDKNGGIIGIINSKHVDAENASYAIKSTYLLNLIQSLSIVPSTEVNTLIGKSLVEQIKIISKFVYIIKNE